MRKLSIALIILSFQSLPIEAAETLQREWQELNTRIAAEPACRKALEKTEPDNPSATLQQRLNDLRTRIAAEPACANLPANPNDVVARLEKLERELENARARVEAETARYDALAREVARLREDVTGVSPEPPIEPPPEPTAAKPSVVYTPGAGLSVDFGNAKLSLSAEISLLSSLSTRRPVVQANPLFLQPTDPDTTFDTTARQSKFRFAFQGPRIGDFTPGAFALFTLSDSLTAEGFSFSPVVAYGDLASENWRFAAGLQYDVFLPRDPKLIPSALLAASGNPGSYRPQGRVEYSFRPSEDFQTTFQFAISSPITTSIDNLPTVQTLRLVEDNGLPNFEARVNFGIGQTRELAGNRTLRPIEFGISGIYGQLRAIDANPTGNVIRRSIVDVWGVGADTHLAFTDRFGFSGEFYVGQSLGEYLAGITQSFNTDTLRSIPTLGGWGEFYYYFTDNLHWHVGYGIDTAEDSNLLSQNQTIFSNLIWNIFPQLQFSFEVDYRMTDYVRFGRKDGWIFLTEFLWRL